MRSAGCEAAERRQVNSYAAVDYFGEMAVFDDEPRSATIVAREQCQLLTLDGEHLVTAGSDVRFALLGGRFVGENALLRFYVLHCVFVPVIAIMLMAVHFWRVRKDGGISGPL